MSEYDAIVVGGGIVGASTAYHLARAGAETVLFDREDDGRATDAGAGILAPETSARLEDRLWGEFAIAAVAYYEPLVAGLTEEGIDETGYERCGKLTVAVSADEIAPYERTKSIALDRQRRTGHPDADHLREISPGRARELFPPLTDVERALYYRDAARVDGGTVTAALRTAATAHGLRTRQESVERLTIDAGAVTGVESESGSCRADAVVIAGGAWSETFGEQLGVGIPVSPQRGQIVHLDLEDRETAAWPIVSAFREQYLVAWPDGRVAAGATRESDVGYAPRTTAAGVRDVLDETLRVAPGLADASIGEIRVGLRPLSADGLPVLGPVPGTDGVFLATGHGPTGLQLGPYSGKLVADLVRGRGPDWDIDPFAIDRFQGP